MTTHTTTRSLSVNAAFLKDIKDDNQHLKQLLDKISFLSSHVQTASNHWREFVELLGDLRDQLALHFSLEEAYGYFDDAIDTAPQLSTIAECLRGEHPKLFEFIRDIADRAPEVPYENEEKVSALLARVEAFRHKFAAHEENELKLILEAFDDGIGVGD